MSDHPPAFLRKFAAVRDRDDGIGWLGTCPLCNEPGFPVVVSPDETDGRYTLACVGHCREPDILNALGIDDAELRLNGAAEPPTVGAEFQPFDVFGDEEEPTAEPLLGTAEETLLPKGGSLLMYGDGGAGKTTLALDAAVHLAAGADWLELPVPKPMRVLLLENEGPRGKFRQQSREKRQHWERAHPDLPLKDAEGQYRISVAKDPWGQWDLNRPSHREQLAAHINEHQVDLLICGPLVTLGMIGGGTPEEVAAFEVLLRLLRDLLNQPLAVWLIHHENKQGDVSGAWERMPDTLVHVQARGNGHTHIVWRKVRWSTELHDTSADLDWAEGRGYQVVEKPPEVAYDRVLAETEQYVLSNSPCNDSQVRKEVVGNTDQKTKAIKQLETEGKVIDAELRPKGSRGVARKYWHRDREDLPLTLQNEFYRGR